MVQHSQDRVASRGAAEAGHSWKAKASESKLISHEVARTKTMILKIEEISAGSRAYEFTVQENAVGQLCLAITEFSDSRDSSEHEIAVPKEYVADFCKTLMKVAAQLEPGL